MKKAKKILIVMLVLMIGISMIAIQSHADLLSDAKSDKTANIGEFSGIVQSVVGFIRGIALAGGLISILVIGVKMIVGSSEEKAKYKEMLLPLIVGVVIVVFATTIVSFLFGLGG